MAGNKIGGLKARDTNKRYHGADFYSRIGHLGGVGDRGNKADKGFGSMPKEKISAAGRKGGLISKRGKGKKHADSKRSSWTSRFWNGS